LLVADLWNPDNNIGLGTDSPKTVFIVDNQPRETAALRKQLTVAGFRTEVATTGAGAIKLEEEQPPDIVLLEASLSDIDCLEVLAFIRSDLRACRMLILAMSVLPHMKGRCLNCGCDDFLQKPVKILDLVARIRKALR
jgi:two-component system, OmpR family, response regulator MprA